MAAPTTHTQLPFLTDLRWPYPAVIVARRPGQSQARIEIRSTLKEPPCRRIEALKKAAIKQALALGQ